MLAAINLDDEAPFAAHKINYVRADRLLTHKLGAINRAGPNSIPKSQFCVCGVRAKPPCSRGLDHTGTAHVETPPSPAALCAATSPGKRGEVEQAARSAHQYDLGSSSTCSARNDRIRLVEIGATE